MRGSLQKAKNQRRGLKKGEISWDIIMYLGRGPNGKHRQKWVRYHGTKKQAQEKLTQLVGEIHRGEFIEPTKTTLGQWLDEYVEKAVKPPRSTLNTYRVYRGIIENHLKPALGHLLLQQVTPLHIERYYADAKFAPRTVHLHHMILQNAFRNAQNAGIVRHNVVRRATNKPRIGNADDSLDNVWTADEAKRFLTTVKQHATAQTAALFALALDGGLRKSELLGLQWRDLEGATLRVERQVVRGEDKTPTFTLPKSKKARTLDLSEETLTLLREHKRQQAELKMANRPTYQDHGLVFAQSWEHRTSKGVPLGVPLTMMRVNTQVLRFCKLAEVRPITVHGLRHTCATLLLAAGVPPHVVQKRLGHAKIEITLNLYAHVLPNMQADAASKLASLLHG